MSEKIKSGLEQANSEKFKKLVNEIKKKMNLKLYENEFIEVYEPEIPRLVFININGKNYKYSKSVKTFKIVHVTDRNDNIYLKLEFETGFSIISMSIIKTIKIRNSVSTIKIKVE